MDVRLDGITLEEALHLAYDDNLDVGGIYMEPPEANTLTDKDSGDEDDGGLADNLSRNQLQARAEIIVQNNNDVEGTDVAVEYSGETPGKVNISWLDGDLVPSQKVFPKENKRGFQKPDNC
ncbi:hypothetical protein MML48_3g00011870 [Holotrichia oblita]|uniref:Uncharacterized protein n=1 Tax=Holotrichia oblita TaxID=644536 RepID=A0ACB9TE36_HOLOL|nr:hypothetical protein MML48_3g00011870 [Holotrichia oblita]